MASNEIHLSVDRKVRKLLKGLKKKTGSSSFHDVIGKALSLYDFVADLQENDKHLYVLHDNGEYEAINFE